MEAMEKPRNEMVQWRLKRMNAHKTSDRDHYIVCSWLCVYFLEFHSFQKVPQKCRKNCIVIGALCNHAVYLLYSRLGKVDQL